MSVLQELRTSAFEAKHAAANHEKQIRRLCHHLCRRMGLTAYESTIAPHLALEAKDNVMAIRKWLDSMQPDWSAEPEFLDEAELCNRLEVAIRGSMPPCTVGA